MLAPLEVASLALSYTQTIATIASNLQIRLKDNPTSRKLLDEGHKVARKLSEEIADLISNAKSDFRPEIEAQLRNLSSQLPNVRALLSNSRSPKELSVAIQQLGGLRLKLLDSQRVSETTNANQDPPRETPEPRAPTLVLDEEVRVWSDLRNRYVVVTASLDPSAPINRVSRALLEELGHSAQSRVEPAFWPFLDVAPRLLTNLVQSSWQTFGWGRKPPEVVSLKLSHKHMVHGDEEPTHFEFHVHDDEDVSSGRLIIGCHAIDHIPVLQSKFGELSIREGRKDGLQRIHTPTETIAADVVFVHGLNGDSQTTWKGESDVFWPRELLANDLKKCSIWTYTYDSNIMMDKKASNSIKTTLEDLANDLVDSVERNTQKSLIFVCHSLGGLLVKAALTRSRAKQNSVLDEPIFARTLGVIFVGTPHTGSALSTRAALFTSIISTFSGHSPANRHESMMGETGLDSTITLATSKFAVLMDEKHFPIVSLFETNPTLTEAGPRTIVSPVTRLHHPQESWDRLEGNHLSMCKFDTREESGYQRILGLLESFRDGTGTQEMFRSMHKHKRLHSGTVSDRSDISDGEGVDIDAIYNAFRRKVDLPSARWQSAKTGDSADGTWIRRSPHLTKWLDDPDFSTLLIRGPVGCGKTVIAESILEHIRERSVNAGNSQRICQMQIFFKSDQVAEDFSPISLLRSLIAQMLDQNNDFVRYVDKKSLLFASRSADGRSLSETVEPNFASAILLGTLRLMLEDTCWASTYLIVDALDECPSKYSRDTIEILSVLSRVPSVRTVLTISTTPDNFRDWDSRLHDFSDGRSTTLLNLLEDEDGWRVIMNSYIAKRVSEAQEDLGLSNDEVGLLCKRLIELPQVSFIVVDLLLQHFQELYSVSKGTAAKTNWFNREISELRTRGDLYNILVDLTGRLGQQSQTSIRILTILACATGPMRLPDLVSIMQLYEDSATDHRKELDTMAHDITELVTKPLRQLVQLDGNGLHLSSGFVRRVILERMKNPPLWEEPDQVHLRIAKACLNILIQQSTEAQSTNFKIRISQTAASSYAIAHWHDHYNAAGPSAYVINGLKDQFERISGSQQNDMGVDIRFTVSTPSDETTEQVGSMFGHITGPIEMPDAVTFVKDLDDWPDFYTPASRLKDRDLLQLVSRDPEVEKIFEVLKSSKQEGKALLSRDLANPKVGRDKYLRKAISEKNIEIVNLILQSYSDHLHVTSELLAYAVVFDSKELVLTLLKRKKLFNMNTAFVRAAEIANLGICEDLLAHGAKIAPDVGKKSPSTPLHLAARRGQKDLVVLMLKWNAPVNIRDFRGRTSLHRAASYGHVDVVEQLLASSASVVAEDNKGRTALFLACANGHKNTARKLWLSGSKLSQRDHWQRSMLHAAANTGHESIIEMLLSAGISPNCYDNFHRTPLHEAALKGRAPIVARLLDAGADVDATDDHGKTALHFACQSYNAPEIVVRLLLERGADPGKKTYNTESTPLLLCASSSTVRVFKLFAALHRHLFFTRDRIGRNAFQIVEAEEENRKKTGKTAVDCEEKRKFLLENFPSMQPVLRQRTKSLSDMQSVLVKDDLFQETGWPLWPELLKGEETVDPLSRQNRISSEPLFDPFATLEPQPFLKSRDGSRGFAPGSGSLPPSRSQSPAFTES